MGASALQLEKLLNSALPKLFPDVKRVDVKEEKLDKHTFHLHVFVVMDENTIPTIQHNPKYSSDREPNVNEFANIKKKIKELAYYLLLHVNQVTFGVEM
jgi:hypothetical protein